MRAKFEWKNVLDVEFLRAVAIALFMLKLNFKLMVTLSFYREIKEANELMGGTTWFSAFDSWQSTYFHFIHESFHLGQIIDRSKGIATRLDRARKVP